MAPRGIRNNNPGNIEFGRFTRSHGAIGSDGRFARFRSPEEGIAAIVDLQRTYEDRHGLKSVLQRINRWAPAGENNPNSYAAAVAREMGIPVNQPFSIRDPEMAQRFIAAMIRVENGRQPYTPQQIAAGYQASKTAGGAPVSPASAGPSPETVRLAQEALAAQGYQVTPTGQLDEATTRALGEFRASPGGMAFAQRHGLPVAPQGREMAFAAEANNPAAGAVNAVGQGAPVAAPPERPPVQMRIAPETPPTLPGFSAERTRPPQYITDPDRWQAHATPAARTFDPRPVQTVGVSAGSYQAIPGNERAGMPPLPERARDPQFLGWGPSMSRGALAPETTPVFPTPQTAFGPQAPPATTAPLPNTITEPPDPVEETMLLARQSPVNPVTQYMAMQQLALQQADRARGVPVMPPQTGTPVSAPPVVDVTGGQFPIPRPNPMGLPGQRPLRAGVMPNGFRWQHTRPQPNGPAWLNVRPGPGMPGRPYSQPLGRPGGAGLYNEFMSSFVPVIWDR